MIRFDAISSFDVQANLHREVFLVMQDGERIGYGTLKNLATCLGITAKKAFYLAETGYFLGSGDLTFAGVAYGDGDTFYSEEDHNRNGRSQKIVEKSIIKKSFSVPKEKSNAKQVRAVYPNGDSKIFLSMRDCARELSSTRDTIKSYIEKEKPFEGIKLSFV